MVPRNSYIQFFNAYQDLRKNHDFLPEFIFNIDETMVDVISNPEKVILFKDDTNPVIPEPKQLKHMTLLLGLPCQGQPLRPLVIFNEDVESCYDIYGQSFG